jgi:hypothetical protein
MLANESEKPAKVESPLREVSISFNIPNVTESSSPAITRVGTRRVFSFSAYSTDTILPSVLDAGGGCRGNLTRWCGVGNQSDSLQYCDPGRHLYAGRDGELGRANRIDELHFGIY